MSFTQPSTLFLMNCSLNDSIPITAPRWHSPWSVILMLVFLESSFADSFALLFFVMRMVFAHFGQFPKSGTLTFRLSHHF